MPNRTLLPLMLVMTLAAVALLYGCSPQNASTGPDPRSATPMPGDEVTVYFSKSRGSKSVTEGVVRPHAKQPKEKAAAEVEFALQELLKGPSDDESLEGFYSEIPKGTRLLEVAQENTTLSVNLSSQFVSGGGSNSVQQRMAELTKTIFATVPRDHKVYVLVDGQPLEVVGGEGLEVPQPLEQAIQ